MEIEKKYLFIEGVDVSKLIDMSSRKYEIEQFYLNNSEGDVRYRARDGVYFKTIKTGSGLAREEFEEEVPLEEYNEALLIAKDDMLGAMIKKTRYIVPFEGLIYELDVFKDNLESLVLMEVEFNTVASALSHNLPDLFLSYVESEVTEDSRYVNMVLATTKDVASI